MFTVARVGCFDFGEDCSLYAVLFGDSVHLHQRRMADGFKNVFVPHGAKVIWIGEIM